MADGEGGWRNPDAFENVLEQLLSYPDTRNIQASGFCFFSFFVFFYSRAKVKGFVNLFRFNSLNIFLCFRHILIQ